jgi:hypothetical protein
MALSRHLVRPLANGLPISAGRCASDDDSDSEHRATTTQLPIPKQRDEFKDVVPLVSWRELANGEILDTTHVTEPRAECGVMR